MKKYLFTILTLALLSCSQIEDENILNDDNVISQSIKFTPTMTTSRVTTALDYSVAFNEGDEVGVFACYTDEALGAADNYINNLKITLEANGEWSYDQDVVYPVDGESLDFYAYYPYVEGANPLNITFAVQSDQSVNGGMGKSDLLYGTASNIRNIDVTLSMSHLLSLVEVTAVKGDYTSSFTDEISANLTGMVMGGSLDLGSGNFVADSSITGDVEMECVTSYSYSRSFRAVIPAQTISENSTMANIKQSGDDGFEFSYTPTTSYDLVAGDAAFWSITLTDIPTEGGSTTHSSLLGSNYFPIALDDITYGEIADKVVVDLRVEESDVWLYIWDYTYNEKSCEGLNAYGQDATWTSLTVGTYYWSGLGIAAGVSGDYTNVNSLSAVTDSPDEYFLHIALKSSVAASHLIKFESIGSAVCVIGNNGSIYDNLTECTIDYAFVTDGEWQHFDIPMTHFTNQGFSFNSSNTGSVNIFMILSGGTVDAPLDYDAVFFYKK